jgi:adenylate cyclase class 2
LIEREVKIRVRGDSGSVVEWFKSKGFVPSDSCYEEDRYFTHPCRDLRSTDEALRLRFRRCDSGAGYYLTYKGPRLTEGVVKSRLEIEAELSSEQGEVIGEILKRMGFNEKFVVRKKRVIMKCSGLNVTIDDVEGLGLFVEIEGEIPGWLTKMVEGASWFNGYMEKTYLELLIEGNKVS